MHPVNNSKERFCRLCMNVISDTNCQAIGEAIRDVLEIVLPNVNLEERNKHVICITCSIKLSDAFNFKSTCMDTEDIISAYVNSSKMSVVDLKEVYLKENGNIQLTDILENQKICLLCIQLITRGSVSVNEVDVDIIEKFMSRQNIGCTKDSFLCELCFDSLRTHGTFLKNCFDAQEKYKNIDKRSYIKTENIEIKLEESHDMQEKYRSTDKQPYIKFEEIEIKVEDQDSDPLLYHLENETIKNKMGYTFEDEGEIKREDILKCEPGFNENLVLSMSVPSIQICNSEESRFEKGEPSLDVQFYRCEKCKYETKLEADLQTHRLIHITPSKIQVFMCDMCSYETKRKAHLKLHQLQHKDLSDIQMYKCARCSFETKYRNSIRAHQITHKNTSEIQMYTCDTCTYKTKYKRVLNRHQLMHKDPSEVQMYMCDSCSYKTKLKSNLNRHQLVHKNISKTEIYKCDDCAYETKDKRNLKDHQLKHKDPSEVQMYKCDACSFETKRKRHLKMHQLIHKDPSEIYVYTCDTCTYETKYKNHLSKHQLIHKDTLEIQV
ncbi:zinc finger protein 90-like [Anoplophora glabripennis]|uniref:zinc finger protein 90-like n=1 Tax=Anoplophora glabripennis TaxID=217634 RepID=UPI0008738814|nr:zinc finger protein 90-like [Anoplophora glabripennis]